MADAAAAANGRARRTRTGCLRCRVRRRKCDEGKPICQRCQQSGFTCQYGTRLSFLEKNARTVDVASEAPANTAGYSFVLTSPAKKKSQASNPNPNPQPTPDDVRPPRTADSASTTSPFPVSSPSDSQPPALLPSHAFSPSYSPPDRTLPPADLYQTPSHELPTPSSLSLMLLPDSPADSNAAYVTALDGLLSLGAENHPPDLVLEPAGTPGTHTQDLPQDLPQDLSHDLSQAILPPLSPLHTTEPLTGHLSRLAETDFDLLPIDEFPNCAHIPQDRCVQLMRHYRYNIAPWLDIDAPGQTFGLIVSRIAFTSRPVLEAVMSLTFASLGYDSSSLDWDRYLQQSLPQKARHETSSTESVLVCYFEAIRRHMVTPPTSWEAFEPFSLSLLNAAIADSQDTSVSMAVSWLFLRLQLSLGLMSESAVQIPDILLAIGSPFSTPHASRDVREFGHRPLLLCAQVLNYCFGPEDLTTSTRPAQWTMRYEALGSWYQTRPRSFKPVVELADSADGVSDPSHTQTLFPLIIFTSGTSVLANQMYHTAMLLLLLHRPRTVPHNHSHSHGHSHGYGRSFLDSSLWHAQRICGIALNNDSRSCWDFSLVAALFVAAKRMTYSPQQQAILAGLEGIQSLTRWNLGDLSTRLGWEWQPD